MLQVAESWLNEGLIRGLIISRLISNGISGAAFLASIGLIIAIPDTTIVSIPLVGVMLAFIIGAFFLIDVSTLPINIFYLMNLDSDTDFSNKWLQVVAFASPIITGLVYVFGALIELIFTILNNGDIIDVSLVSAVLFLPQLLQLVPSILYAVYVKDMNSSV